MKKRSVMLSSLLVIVLCVVLVVGSTFSLFSGSSTINISLTSGEVKIEAEIESADLYSAKISADGEHYEETKQENGKFANGGTATVEDDGSISFRNVSAGDKAVLYISLKNKSNIAVKYNTTLTLLDQDKSDLFKAIEKTVASEQAAKTAANLSGESAPTDPDGVKQLNTYKYDDKTVRSGWVSLGLTDADRVTVSLGLPVDAGNALQNQTIKIRLRLSAIQDTGDVSGIANVGGEDCGSLQEALYHAKDGDTIEFVRGDTRLNEEELIVDKSVKFVSADGEPYPFVNARFKVTEGASLTLDGLTLTGNSRIDVSNASSFTMKNCIVESAPEKLFDELTRENLERAAFVAATSAQQSGVKVEITGNTFRLGNGAQADAAAVYLKGTVADGSVIAKNDFGEGKSPFSASAVYMSSVAPRATVSVSENTVYAASAVTVDNSARNAFALRLAKNKLFAAGSQVKLVTVKGGGSAEIYDSGSVVNGNAVAEIHFEAPNVLFYGYNVAFDLNGLVVSGNFTLSGLDQAAFRNNYVSPLATDDLHY